MDLRSFAFDGFQIITEFFLNTVRYFVVEPIFTEILLTQPLTNV